MRSGCKRIVNGILCKDDSGYITTKTAKIKKGDITWQHTDYVAICC